MLSTWEELLEYSTADRRLEARLLDLQTADRAAITASWPVRG
jgi:hypothetical protein